MHCVSTDDESKKETPMNSFHYQNENSNFLNKSRIDQLQNKFTVQQKFTNQTNINKIYIKTQHQKTQPKKSIWTFPHF